MLTIKSVFKSDFRFKAMTFIQKTLSESDFKTFIDLKSRLGFDCINKYILKKLL